MVLLAARLTAHSPTAGRAAPELLRAYEPPPHFRDDLFALLDGAALKR